MFHLIERVQLVKPNMIRKGSRSLMAILIIGTLLLINNSSAASKNGFDLANTTIPQNQILGGSSVKDGIPAIF
jgi:hypothetical protein